MNGTFKNTARKIHFNGRKNLYVFEGLGNRVSLNCRVLGTDTGRRGRGRDIRLHREHGYRVAHLIISSLAQSSSDGKAVASSTSGGSQSCTASSWTDMFTDTLHVRQTDFRGMTAPNVENWEDLQHRDRRTKRAVSAQFVKFLFLPSRAHTKKELQ